MNCQNNQNLSHLNHLKNLKSSFVTAVNLNQEVVSPIRNILAIAIISSLIMLIKSDSHKIFDKRFTPPCRPIRGRHFNSHHNNNVHHSTDNRNSHQYNTCSVLQASTQVSQPAICDANSSQVTCQICSNRGHSVRDCPSARVQFDLKESITTKTSF